jgi:hypothetical protein
MTALRIQALESLSFEWVGSGAREDCKRDNLPTTWKAHFSELVYCCKIHGHCNVPKNCSENPMLCSWVGTQRKQYRSHLKENISTMTNVRIQALESLSFEWKPTIFPGKETQKKESLDDDTMSFRKMDVMQTIARTQKEFSVRDIRSNQADVAFESKESDWNGEIHLAYIPGRTEES